MQRTYLHPISAQISNRIQLNAYNTPADYIRLSRPGPPQRPRHPHWPAHRASGTAAYSRDAGRLTVRRAPALPGGASSSAASRIVPRGDLVPFLPPVLFTPMADSPRGLIPIPIPHFFDP